MRPGPLISLGLSVIVGIVAVVFGRNWLDREASAALPPPTAEVIVEEVATVPILVAATSFERGDAVNANALDVVDWPEAFLPAGAMSDASELVLPDGSYPYSLGVIAAGEPIVPAKLSMQRPRETLAGLIEPGFRAVSIEVDDDTGVAGFVLPDHRVDVILSREQISRDGAKSFKPETLVQNVRVLAVDQQYTSDLDGASLARTVTLEVSPAQAGTLTAGADIGRLGLALRAKDDVSLAAPQRRTVSSRPRTPARSTASVRIIEGEEEKMVTAPVARSRTN